MMCYIVQYRGGGIGDVSTGDIIAVEDLFDLKENRAYGVINLTTLADVDCLIPKDELSCVITTIDIKTNRRGQVVLDDDLKYAIKKVLDDAAPLLEKWNDTSYREVMDAVEVLLRGGVGSYFHWDLMNQLRM